MIIKKWPVFQCLLVALVLACAPCLAAQAEAVDEPVQDQTFRLTQTAAKDALTVLRSIVGTKNFRVADERTIVVRDTAEILAMAAAVVEMADSSDAPAAEGRLAVSDGTVITCVTLENAWAVDVMEALRTQMRIARIATLGEKKVFLRDTDDQITAALKVISELESPASH
jgi:hypothetical protein